MRAILEALADGCADCAQTLRRGRGKVHCPLHSDTTGSLDVQEGDNGKPLLYCHSCKDPESKKIIAHLRERGLWKVWSNGAREANRSAKGLLGEKGGPTLPLRVINGGAKTPAKATNVYDYIGRRGEIVMRVVRYEPKTFRQCRPDGKGGWIWDLEGVTRVLYRLPEVIAAVAAKEMVFICEGEKDADALAELGLVATTNSGGAGKWLASYSADLVGIDVVIIEDKDEPGRAHARSVAESVVVGASSVRIVSLPGPGKDVSDWIAAGGTKEELLAVVARTPTIENQILTGADLVAMYRDVVAKRMTGDTDYLEIPTGLGELDKYAQYQPGDLWLVVAATGVGKSAMLSTMQMSLDDREIPSLFVSLEMSWLVIVERLLAGGVTLDQLEGRVGLLVDEASLTTDRLETLAKVAKLRGARVLFVDYAQRLAGDRKDSEYERVSAISNDLARIARETRLCIVAAAQVSRQGASRDGNPPQLSEIRASGHLEQDAAVVLALGRKSGDSLTTVAIQKNRHGQVKRLSLIFDAKGGKFIYEKSSGPASREEQDVGPLEIPF